MNDATPREETPVYVPDYNTPAPKSAWFNPFKAPTDFDGFYSPFWPLTIVFVAFIILLVYEVSTLRYRKLVLQQQNANYNALMPKIKEQYEFLNGMRADLEALAPTHPEADKLAKEFFPESSVDTKGSAIPDSH